MKRMDWDDFTAFVGMLPRPAVAFDESLRVIAANVSALAMLGCEAADLMGRPCATLGSAGARLAFGGHAESSETRCDDALDRLTLAGADGTSLTLAGPTRRAHVGDDAVVLMLLEAASPTDLEHGRTEAKLREFAICLWQVGVFEHDHVNDSVFVCPRMGEIYGLAPGQRLTLQTLADRVHPGDQERIRRQVTAAHDPDGDGQFDVRQRIVRGDGRVRWVRCRAQTTFGEIDGRRAPVLTRGTVMDVTESEVLAEELRHSEHRVQQAIRASRVGLYEIRFDPSHGGQTHWSWTMRELLGFPADAEPDYGWFSSRIHPDDAAILEAAVAHADDPAGDGLTEAEYRWRHPDGSLRWLMARGITYFGEVDGRRVPVNAVGAILDITEQKSADADRRQRTAILDITPDIVWIAASDGRLVYLNRAGRALLGMGLAEDLSARSAASFYPPAVAERTLAEGFAAAVREGVWSAEVEFQRHDGAIVPVSQVIIAHREHEGTVERFSTIARDRTRERDLEEQFRQAHKMEAIGRLAGGIAHDFNNLISAITGFTEMASLQLDAGHPAVKDLEQVQLAADRAASLTRQLLAFGRKQILQPRVMDLNATLRDMLPMLRRLLDDSIEISMLLPSSAVSIKADPNQIQQILLNLVVNARDAMPSGGVVTIETQSVTLDSAHTARKLDLKPGRYAMIAVSDTGSGMDDATRARIFEPFFTTKGAGKGTGLGLSTVFGIVQQSGGSIWVYSELGQGTTFRISFPSTDEPSSFSTESSASVGTCSGGVVLLVDDNEQLRDMVDRVLTRAGYTVLNAETPAEALRLARDYPGAIDLLLTDVLMPMMSGREVATQLLELRPSTAVLYMSGYTENSIVHHGVLDPGVNFIAKPLTPSRLLDALRGVLARRGAATSSERLPAGSPPETR
ncbi:MAG: PAS domain-containing protein [Polyangiaceae bacterium]|nr:PAS domain-containing protein [Polyangiaceae bacterium]